MTPRGTLIESGRWAGFLIQPDLVAKQGWRLIHQTNSPRYKVFKGKYFPICVFIDSNYLASQGCPELRLEVADWRRERRTDLQRYGGY